jgi:glycerol-3-phosphate cytidylyltransferase-like family protein
MQSFEDSETTRDRIVATIDPVMEAVASGQMRTTRVALEAVMAYVALVEFWRDDFGDDERENAHNAVEFCMLAATALATSRLKRGVVRAIDNSLRRQGLAPQPADAWPPWAELK